MTAALAWIALAVLSLIVVPAGSFKSAALQPFTKLLSALTPGRTFAFQPSPLLLHKAFPSATRVATLLHATSKGFGVSKTAKRDEESESGVKRLKADLKEWMSRPAVPRETLGP
jgi:hypothetical protein